MLSYRTVANIERLIDTPDVVFARAKDLFGFTNYEQYPMGTTKSVIRSKNFPNFEVRCELWGEIGEIGTKLEVRVIPKGQPEPVLSFSLEPLRGVTEVKPNYPMAIDIEEYSFPVQIPPVEISEKVGVQLAGTLVDWLEKTLETGEIEASDPRTPSVSVKNLEIKPSELS